MARIPGLDSGEEFPSIHETRSEIWEIPTSFLFHPISMDNARPDFPSVITVNVDKYRDRIINYSHNVGAELGLTGQDMKDDLIEEDSDGDDDDDKSHEVEVLERLVSCSDLTSDDIV
jgi:hypothetical protein